MGLFHKQQQSDDDAVDLTKEEQFFDKYFREELRNHGRWYFEKIINENGLLFKKDLDTTVDEINTELKEHITRQLDDAIAHVTDEIKNHATKQIEGQFAEFAKTMQEAQRAALEQMTASAHELEGQYKNLSETLTKNVADQDALLHNAFEDSKAQLISMKDAQGQAIQWLNHSAQELQDQQKQLTENLAKNVAEQEQVLIEAFESNMAQTVEHYLLGALGDQYDLKAQLPSIIKQLEANKQEMVDDIKL